MGSYIPYPFSCTVVDNQLVFTFTGIPASTTSLTLPNPYYVNIPNLYIKIDRLRPNLVHFGDSSGIITVDYTLSTNPNPAGGLPAWIILLLSLLPVNQITDQYTAVSKSTIQNIGTGTTATIIYNAIQNNGTDVSYNIATGVFTVNVSGIYTYTGMVGFSASIGGGGAYYYMFLNGATERAAFVSGTSYNSFGGTRRLFAGDTFTIRVQNDSGVTISPNFSIGGITTKFSIVRTGI